MSVEPLVEVEVDNHVATVRLCDRPRRNALSTALVEQLLVVSERDDVDAFVLTGSEGFFCAGADVDELASGAWTGDEPTGPPVLFRRISEDARPWVAAVDGPAIGGGCELAMSCDLVVMADDAWLRMPEASLGVLPNTGTYLLGGVVPHNEAMGQLLGLQRVDAVRGVALGLVHASVPAEELHAYAQDLASTILRSVAPTAFTAVKHALRVSPPRTWHDVSALLARTDDDEVSRGIAAMRRRERVDWRADWRAGSGARNQRRER